jgi:hypothetical protein
VGALSRRLGVQESMQKFQIRYFRRDELEKVELVEAPDLLEVIERASPPEQEVTAEIWSRIGKVGMVGPLPEQTGGDQARSAPEAEVAEVMKARLRLVRS